MIECCGKDRTTPFCPMCGRAIDGHNVLYGLLSHIQGVVRSYECRRQSRLSHCDNDKTHPLVKGVEKKMKKWVDWQDALARAISISEQQPQDND